MLKTVYIGNEFSAIDSISVKNEIEILAVFFQPEKTDQRMKIFYPNISFIPVTSKMELRESISHYYSKIDFAIMYSFGVIIPKDVLDNVTIYNFHPGDLRTNRGSSPINWSILLDDKDAVMTLHRVESTIDTGLVVSEHKCKVYDFDVPSTLKSRMAGELPSMMHEFLEYYNKRITCDLRIYDGIYRQRIVETDYTIKPEDNRSKIFAKIRSQYDYKGAIFDWNGKRYYIKSLDEYDKIRNKNV